MKKLSRALAVVLTTLLVTSTSWAQWDKTKPANGSPLVSSEIRNNWDALEKTAGTNLMRDPALEVWYAGGSAAPTYYTLSGAGATIAQTGTGLGDTTRQVGKYAAKVTWGAATATLCQDVWTTNTFDTGLRSRSVSVGWWAKTSTASQVRIRIDDGIGTTDSSYHTGGGSFEWLKVTRTLDAAATKVTVCARVESSGSAYFSASTAQLGSVSPDDYRPPLPSQYELTSGASLPAPGGLIYVDSTQHANGTTVETDLSSKTIDADTLRANHQMLRVVAWGTFANNANTKTVRAYFAGTSVTMGPSAFGSIARAWVMQCLVVRTGASAQKMACALTVGDATTGNVNPVAVAAPAGDTTTGLVVKTTGQSNTASSDVLQEGFFIEAVG